MKSVFLNVDPNQLKENPELETSFIKMFGRDSLNEVYSDNEGFDFTEEEVSQMNDSEYEQNREKILRGLSEGRIK